VQLEDKLVDGRDAAHAESQHRQEVHDRGDEVLPEPVAEAVHDAPLERRTQLLGAIRMVLDRQTLTVDALRLPQRESLALEALQVAVSARSTDLNQFVYASDRRDLLEQALAVLQPDLVRADDVTARELHAQFVDLTQRVGELRQRLGELEESQDELDIVDKLALGKADGDTDTKPKPPGDPDAPRPASALTGPELPEPARPATTLSGPELPEPARPATTLTGPELPEPARPATTLTGPEIAEPARPATALTGPELPDPVPPPSTLGADPEPGAPTAQRSWWRR
jgi:hypothetical protein